MKRAAIVGGCRTPFVKAGGVFSRYSWLDLSIHTVSSLVERLNVEPDLINELVYGAVLLDPRLPNFAREVILRSDLPESISAHSVSNNCISGLVAINVVAEAIKCGRIKTGIGGGAESMSCPALTVHPRAEDIFISLSQARTFGERLRLIFRFRPQFFLPQAPSPKEPSTGLTMGEHTEIIAKEFSISRREQDEFAFLSHKKAAKAQEQGILAQEIAPIGEVERDNLVRPDTSPDKLAKLKPVFDKSEAGTLTAGNSSALTDGASAVCLMEESEAVKRGVEILGFVDAVEYAAIKPADGLLMAPAVALPRLLEKNNLTVEDIDLFEIHEAFAAQVIANLRAWEYGWDKAPGDVKAIGAIPGEKINICGGSLALGHPFAATGGRLVLSLAHSLKRLEKNTGVISVCAAGGMAAAVLIRRT